MWHRKTGLRFGNPHPKFFPRGERFQKKKLPNLTAFFMVEFRILKHIA